MKKACKTISAKYHVENPDYLTGYASVEVVDLEGDIIRIDGIDLSAHTSDNPIKLFPDHQYSLPDGMPCVLGRIINWEKTIDPRLNVPALKFTAEWSKKTNGELTDIAKAWKELYDTGMIDSFSVGVDRVDGHKIENGVDWTKTKLLELSAAQLPANNFANICKTLHKYNIDIKEKSMSDISGLNPIGNAQEGGLTYKKDGEPDMAEHLSKCFDMHKKDMGDMMQMHMSKCMDHITKCIGDCNKSIHDRIDDIESSIAVAQDGPDPVYTSEKALKEIEIKKVEAKKKEELVELQKQLKSLRSELVK